MMQFAVYEEHTILFISNILNLILSLLAIGIIFYVINSYKRSSISSIFVYFFTGILLLGAIRLFFLFIDLEIVQLHESAVMVCWHIMFYLSTLMFLLGSRRLSLISNISESHGTMNTALIITVSTTILTLLILFNIPTIAYYNSLYFEHSWFDQIGIYHFIAFAFAGAAAFYIFQIKQKIKGFFGVIATPLLYVFLCLSLIHLWELLTENWKIIPVEDTIIEIGEQVLWIPVFILINYAFWKFGRMMQINFKYSDPKLEQHN